MNKDKIQKVVASVLALAVLTYSYFNFLLGPQGREIESRKTKITALEEEIRKADAQILRTRSLEPQGLEAGEFLAKAEEFFPTGAPIAWFPPMMRAFFVRMGIEDVVLTPKGSSALQVSALEDYEKLLWDIQLNSINFLDAGTAIAALENEQPFTVINRVSVERAGGDIGLQRVGFEMAFTDRKDQ